MEKEQRNKVKTTKQCKKRGINKTIYVKQLQETEIKRRRSPSLLFNRLFTCKSLNTNTIQYYVT